MKKVLIYGAGAVGRNSYYRLDDTLYEIIAFVDKNGAVIGTKINGVRVEDIKTVSSLQFDYVLIASISNQQEMRDILIANKISESKILVFTGNRYENDNEVIELQEERYATMRLCVDAIKERNIPGEVAEVGVYKGEFSKYLNKYFPDKKLYLFDTFEGMENDKEVIEITKGQAFKDTSVEVVMNKMVNPSKCVVCKGFFPSTAWGIEEKFCFVSLDTDLYESILAGLKYFYPRLNKGGYIFVHDFGVYTWSGVKKAVLEYCEEMGISYVPINDLCGSVVFVK